VSKKIEIEIPDGGFEIKAEKGWADDTIVRVYLWGQIVFSETYPFPVTQEWKLDAALRDAKGKFIRSLSDALKGTRLPAVY
jgi:hypothetical protein